MRCVSGSAMLKVLIVDDELPLLRNLASYLGSFTDEFEALTAATGEEAEQLLADHDDIGILLTDVRLPGFDGIELLRRAVARDRHLRVFVMTAFPSRDIRKSAIAAGAIRYLEKPLDLKQLRTALLQAAGERGGWSGSVGGLDIFDFTQLFSMSGKSTAIRVTNDDEAGVLVFRDGKLTHASTVDLSGEPAFYHMAIWAGGTFEELEPRVAAKFKKNIQASTSHVMMEAARLRDEAARLVEDATEAKDDPQRPRQTPTAPADGHDLSTPHDREEVSTMALKDHFVDFETVEGFMGVAVFTSQGEMLEGMAKSNVDIKTIGMYANNALLNAQKATDQMGVGRGNQVTIRAPQATVLMRCLNEATDFAATKEGKAHFHTVVVMDPDGNSAMAGMILEKVVAKVADEVR